MSILINKETKLIVQGMTGSQGARHTKYMREYGTNIVAGVTPGKAGAEIEGYPVYNSIADALEKHTADWSVIFVPAPFVKGAAIEALENNLNVVVITEGVPVHDALEIIQKSKEVNKLVLGPNCPGITTVGEAKIGIMPNHVFSQKGEIGVVSRSGTLTYEITQILNEKNLGQTTVVGIGGDPAPGLNFIEILKYFEEDSETKKIVLAGEIGGSMEEEAAEFIRDNITKPVVAYIVGITAPAEKQMGHAGAIISGSSGTAESKIQALEGAGVKVARLPKEIPGLLG